MNLDSSISTMPSLAPSKGILFNYSLYSFIIASLSYFLIYVDRCFEIPSVLNDTFLSNISAK